MARYPAHSRGPLPHFVSSLPDSVDQACTLCALAAGFIGQRASGFRPACASWLAVAVAAAGQIGTISGLIGESETARGPVGIAYLPRPARVSVHVRVMYGPNQARRCGGTCRNSNLTARRRGARAPGPRKGEGARSTRPPWRHYLPAPTRGFRAAAQRSGVRNLFFYY